MASRENVEMQYEFKKCTAKRSRKCHLDPRRQSDIKTIPQFRANFSKAFPHIRVSTGAYVVDPVEYRKLVRATYKWKPHELLSIRLGNPQGLRLVDINTIFDYELIGKYRGCFSLPLYPSITSAEAAGEMVELYEMALLRDIPFVDWNTSPEVQTAVNNLNLLSLFHGQVTTSNIFRSTSGHGSITGTLEGPYLSQFLYLPVKMGAATYDQKYPAPPVGVDYITTVEQFLSLWSGTVPVPQAPNGPSRYLATLRDATNYIHYDEPSQPFFNALRILLAMKAPLSQGNPYANGNVTNQVGFVNLGLVDIFDLLSRAGKLAMDAAWYIKWTQPRLRPEEFGYQVQVYKNGDTTVPLNAQLLNNPVLTTIFEKYGTYLLPQAYSEAAPAHPSFVSGHGALAGAECTVLKAWFATNTVFTNPVQSNANGSALIPVPNVTLTVESELNRLAANCSCLRNAAGIHYRTDMLGIQLGEAVAIEMLREHIKRYNLKVTWTIPKFDGTVVTIEN